jgi:hypothetical protein
MKIYFWKMEEDKEDATTVSLLLDTPSPADELDDDNDNIDDNTILEEVLVQQKDEQEEMSTDLEEEAKDSDSMTTTDGCIPTETLGVDACCVNLHPLNTVKMKRMKQEIHFWNIWILRLLNCNHVLQTATSSLREVCGDYIEVDDLLRLLPTVVAINGRDQ